MTALGAVLVLAVMLGGPALLLRRPYPGPHAARIVARYRQPGPRVRARRRGL
jgi:hypothetical protein